MDKEKKNYDLEERLISFAVNILILRYSLLIVHCSLFDISPL